MKQSVKRLFSSFLALLFVVVAFIVFFNMVQPAYVGVSDLKGKDASLNNLLDEQRHVLGEIQKLIGIYESSQTVRDVVSVALPMQPDQAPALSHLNWIAQANGLSAQSFNISLPPRVLTEEARREGASLVQPVFPVSFQIKMVGTYPDFKNFLSNLETNVRVFDVSALSIQPATGGKGSVFSYDLTATAYYQDSSNQN